MIKFVLDNSVAMRWLLSTRKKADQSYANKVLQGMVDCEALVPHLWHLEATNVLLSAEKRGELSIGDVERFVSQLEKLPIQVDPLTAQQASGRILSLARSYRLSSYDASYLELVIREGLPLATLDKNLLKAAKKAEVPLYLKD